MGIEEDLERTRELGFQHTLFVDEELLEDSLVHLPSQLGWCRQVHLVAVRREMQTPLQGGLNLREGQIGSGYLFVHLVELTRDSTLLLAEEVQGYGVRVVGVEQLLSLSFELLSFPRCHSLGVFGGGSLVREILAEDGAKQLCVRRVELDVAPLLFDLSGDRLDVDVAAETAGALLMAPDAEVVVVGAAVPVGLLIEAEPAAAGTTEDRSLEVMRELAPLLPSVVRVEYCLNFKPFLPGDQGLVVPVMLHALPGDQPDVVRVAKHPVQRRACERTLGKGCGGSERHTARRQLIEQT